MLPLTTLFDSPLSACSGALILGKVLPPRYRSYAGNSLRQRSTCRGICRNAFFPAACQAWVSRWMGLRVLYFGVIDAWMRNFRPSLHFIAAVVRKLQNHRKIAATIVAYPRPLLICARNLATSSQKKRKSPPGARQEAPAIYPIGLIVSGDRTVAADVF